MNAVGCIDRTGAVGRWTAALLLGAAVGLTGCQSMSSGLASGTPKGPSIGSKSRNSLTDAGDAIAKPFKSILPKSRSSNVVLDGPGMMSGTDYSSTDRRAS
ncbi:MAG: hypothetical protein ACRC1K_21475, partial [Planctomycetia bacterium]